MSQQPVYDMGEGSMSKFWQETATTSNDDFPYNSNFSEDNWQHYFDYKTEDGKPVGTCRKHLIYLTWLISIFRRMQSDSSTIGRFDKIIEKALATVQRRCGQKTCQCNSKQANETVYFESSQYV